MSKRMPKLIDTLWPLWIDTHISPPLSRCSPTRLRDRSGTELAFYADVPGILRDLSRRGVAVGIASRTSAPELARQALSLLSLAAEAGGEPRTALAHFEPSAVEIYPGSKLRHFRRIHERTGIAFADMVFFDDESRNREVASLGVTFVLVPDGVNRSIFERGLNDWRKGRGVVVERP